MSSNILMGIKMNRCESRLTIQKSMLTSILVSTQSPKKILWRDAVTGKIDAKGLA